MDNKTSLVIFSLSIIVLGSSIAYSGMLLNSVSSLSGASEDNSIKYNNGVCIYKNDDLIQCKSNLFTDKGKNHTRDLLLYSTPLSAISAIALGNTSEAIGQGNISIANELTAANSGCGLHRAAGTIGLSTNTTGYQVGNWSISKQFTNTCASIQVNVTGVFNTTTAAQAGEALFAVTTFSTVTLQPSDTLNITWYMWVS